MNGKQARALRRAVRGEAADLMASRALADVALRVGEMEQMPTEDFELPQGWTTAKLRSYVLEKAVAAVRMVEAIDRAESTVSAPAAGPWRKPLTERLAKELDASGSHKLAAVVREVVARESGVGS